MSKAQGSSSEASPSEVDRLCDRFEAAWRDAPPLPSIEAYLKESAGRGPHGQRNLLAELVMIDMEQRWRRTSEANVEESTSRPPRASLSTLADTLPPQPRIEDYIIRYPQLGGLADVSDEMIGFEYRTRQKWGDGADLAEFQRRFPDRAARLGQLLGDEAVETALMRVKIYDRRRLAYTTQLDRPLEMGRQRSDEPAPFCRIGGEECDRMIIAGITESYISRRQVRIEPAGAGEVKVTNLSAKGQIAFNSHERLAPGESRRAPLPLLLAVAAKAVRVEFSETDNLNLRSLPQPTLAPGLSIQRTEPLKSLSSSRQMAATEMLVAWLQQTMPVFQSAASSADFLTGAAQAAADILALDAAAVMRWRDGSWQADAVRARSGAELDFAWDASTTMLERVRREKRTFRHVPGDVDSRSDSLTGVRALVAAPILDARGDVVGALYGDRRSQLGGSLPDITELEAALVELLACGVSAGLARVEQERAALQARVQFEQFFSSELAQHIEADPAMLTGKDAEITVLFCDIRGFSRISEKLGPAQTVSWISSVMGVLSDCVIDHHGVLVDYIGDELMAMWGAPEARDDHARLACRAALDMLRRLPELNEKWQAELGEPIDVGIGVNSGVARVGNTGTHRKFKYTPLGSTVNVASRVQGATSQVRTSPLITGATAAMLGDEFSTRRVCRVRVKNIHEPIDLFQLTASPTPAWQQLKLRHEEALAAFERNDFHTTTRILGTLVAEHPDDGPTLLLLSRAVSALSSQQSEYDSVWNLPTK
ncbi:MAG: adenylate/guanylate cyclase domain-containing protein [Pirellulaceae bacterium]